MDFYEKRFIPKWKNKKREWMKKAIGVYEFFLFVEDFI